MPTGLHERILAIIKIAGPRSCTGFRGGKYFTGEIADERVHVAGGSSGALDRIESLGPAVVRNPHLHVGRMHDGMLPTWNHTDKDGLEQGNQK